MCAAVAHARVAYSVYRLSGACSLFFSGANRGTMANMEKLLSRRVADAMERWPWRGRRVICAVSGGPDSVALLRVMLDTADALGFTVVGACHFEHGIRGEESEADMRFVQALCKQWDVPLYIERVKLLPDQGALETAAREARRAFYFRAMAALKADGCALGHHADDQAETVLMHMLRGARAPLGMRVCEGPLLRPLLYATREEILDYLQEKNLVFRQDATNLVADNPRNALRLKAMPVLSAWYPGAAAALGRMADYAREDDDCLERLATQWLNQHREGDLVRLLTPLPDDAVLRRALCAYAKGFGADEIGHNIVSRLMDLAKAGTGARLAMRGFSFERSTEGILPVGDSLPAEPVEFSARGVQEHPNTGWRFLSAIVPAVASFGGARGFVQYFDADELPALMLRSRLPGDVMRPFGAPGHKPLKEIFIDRKVPRALRDAIPLLASGDEIIWAVGVARANCAAVTDGTLRILRVEYLADA